VASYAAQASATVAKLRDSAAQAAGAAPDNGAQMKAAKPWRRNWKSWACCLRYSARVSNRQRLAESLVPSAEVPPPLAFHGFLNSTGLSPAMGRPVRSLVLTLEHRSQQTRFVTPEQRHNGERRCAAGATQTGTGEGQAKRTITLGFNATV